MNTALVPLTPIKWHSLDRPLTRPRCLLRTVKRGGGEVDDAQADLPPVLSSLLGDPSSLNVTKSQLRSYLQKQGIPESTVGGSVTDRVCHADSDNPSAPLARYFCHPTTPALN